MISKIYARSVIKMGREPEHSFMVTIPKKICEKLQIEKGTRLYFKFEDYRFVVSKNIKSLENNDINNNDNITMIESIKQENQEYKKEEKEIIMDGVSLADLQY
ncbi:MAG TPA: AbrB/MazE/SpoVT family DNA-binding domain-containing protein [Candidatus Nitrosotalea sp.]|nr:AbrB/MazE/SpoVT family DNA-binding domain-containing protein [Candidatus Nitrosotalea sp.]